MTDDAQCYAMAWLARMIDARTIFEAGTYRGKAARIFGEVNPRARVVTCDPVVKHETWVLPGNVEFVEGDALEVVQSLDKIDVAYVDATGPPHGPYLRWLLVEPIIERLTPNGLIFFDDTQPPEGRPWRGVDEVRGFCQLNLRALKGLSIYHPGGER